MLLTILLVLLFVSAFISWKTYRPAKGNTVFYTWIVVSVVFAFMAKRMLVLPPYTHIYLAVSIILGHSLGVFLRTWDQW
ncbi:MAG: hypothetical protein K8R90_03930 [Candidatus Cloacimonetes bacterium]|nr:hypothetical protein [Candidatus Cloacimonadota bacterium]